MDAFDQLREVQLNGGPAQVDRATVYLDRLMTNPADPKLILEAAVLYDAYLNDPYLTRKNEP